MFNKFLDYFCVCSGYKKNISDFNNNIDLNNLENEYNLNNNNDLDYNKMKNKKLVSFQIQGLNQTKTLGKKFNNTNIHSTNFDSKPQTLINSIFPSHTITEEDELEKKEIQIIINKINEHINNRMSMKSISESDDI
jgi:hypothetical protein